MEHEGLNHGNLDEDDDALPHPEDDTVEVAKASCYEMHNSSPRGMDQGITAPSMHKEFTANDMN